MYNRPSYRVYCSPNEHPSTPGTIARASTPVGLYARSPRSPVVLPQFESPSFSPPVHALDTSGNRPYPVSFNVPPPFCASQLWLPCSSHQSLNHVNHAFPPNNHPPPTSVFFTDCAQSDSFYSFPSTPSFMSTEEQWSMPPVTPQRSSSTSQSQASFKESSGSFCCFRALSDPWKGLVPTKTPDGVCLVSRPVAQRHTVLFAPRDRHRKVESDAIRDSGEPLSKRASIAPVTSDKPEFNEDLVSCAANTPETNVGN